MAWSDWQDDGTTSVWKPALETIREAAARCAAAEGLEEATIVPLAWDEPDIELTWKRGGLSRNLHITLDNRQWPLVVSFSGTVWIDTPGAKRKFRPLAIGKITFETPGEMGERIAENIASAITQVNQMTLELTAFSATHGD